MYQKKVKGKLGLNSTKDEIISVNSLIADNSLLDTYKISFDSLKDYTNDSILQDISDSYTFSKDPELSTFNVSGKNILSNPVDVNQPQTHTFVSDEYSDDYDDKI